MILSKSAIERFRKRQLDDWRWIKGASLKELMRAVEALPGGPPAFKTRPWLHQLACFYVGACKKRFAFHLKMGLGKSKIALDLVGHAIAMKTAQRALIVVPRVVNVASWLDAVAEHSTLRVAHSAGMTVDAVRSLLTQPDANVQVTVVNYATLALALSRKRGKSRVPDTDVIDACARSYDIVVLDEVHMIGNTGSLWYSVLLPVADAARRVWALTGTPIDKDPMTVWPQFRIVDGGATFGETPHAFVGAFFEAQEDAWKGQKLAFNQHRWRELHRMMQHRSLRYADAEVRDLPALRTVRRNVVLTDEQHRHYAAALDATINGDVEQRGTGWVTLRHITAGYVRWRDDDGEHCVQFERNPKLDLLAQLVVDELPTEKIVVCCTYVPTGKLVHERLVAEGVTTVWLYGGTKDPFKARADFMRADGPRVLVMNPEVGGTGLDGLQRVARTLVFYESPSSARTRSQMVSRVHRQGQTDACTVVDLVARATVDAGVLTGIEEGYDLHERVVEGKGRGLL